MLCPWCGSPVDIYGSSWECGWCGDFGRLEILPISEPTQKIVDVTLTFSTDCHVDLTETWLDLKKALDQLAPEQASLRRLLGKVLLHSISAGIQHEGALPDEKKAEELRAFLSNTPDLNLGKSTEEIMREAGQGILFCEEAALSETDCGTFWTKLLSARPAEEYYNDVEPEGLGELLSDLSYACACFGMKKGKRTVSAQDCKTALQEAYYINLRNSVLLHPDTERAKRLLSEGNFPVNEDICREIFLAEYPEEVPHETASDVDDLSWEYILDDVFANDMAKGIRMWRCLLDIAEPSLKRSPKTAEKLLPDWDWVSSLYQEQLSPLLLALKDEHFVSQLFGSAFIGRLQFNVLNACRSCGQEELCQSLLRLALENPGLEENWKKQFRRVFSTAPSPMKPKLSRNMTADTRPDDGTVFHYCSVQIQGIRRTYAYLTGGLPLRVGDWVELPFGKEDALRRGQVKTVMDCTRVAAPWPPEQTKTVTRVIDAPVSKQPTEADVLKKERHIEQPEKPTEKSPVPTPETEPEQPQAKSQAAEAATIENSDEKPVPKKKPFPFGKLIATVLAVAVIAGIASYTKRQAAAYEAALQAMARGDYASAEEGFSGVSSYRDAASLAVYCKYAGVYDGRTEYVGGKNELSSIHLRYDTGLQKDVDALESRVKGYKAKKDDAEEAERRRAAAKGAAEQKQSPKEQYSGKLPVDGMPVSCLKYTSIGAPTETEKCQFYDNMDVHRRYKILHWYNSEGEVIAYCHSHQPKGAAEEIIYAFTYYETPASHPISAPAWTPPSVSGSDHSESIRDEYDNPEDLWEDNRDWFDDEDEAWDYWYR